MSCNKCNKCKKAKCGCSDHALTTPTSCASSTPSCLAGDLCPETFSAGCVVYTGDEIADLGILKGERLDIVVQKLILALTNPTCVFPGNTCSSITGLATTSITSTTASIKWLASSSAASYSVEYREITSMTWLLNPNPTNLVDTLTGLIPDTEYVIRVNTICGSGSCYSLTIKIKTKAV